MVHEVTFKYNFSASNVGTKPPPKKRCLSQTQVRTHYFNICFEPAHTRYEDVKLN